MSDPAPNVPHYALPNVSSRLPEYSNIGAEAVRAAFVPNSYRTISQVRLARAGADKSTVAGSSVSGASGDAVGLLGTMNAPAFKAGNGERGLFSEFVYESSPYDISYKLTSQERKLHEEQTSRVSAKPFVVQSTTTTMFGQHNASDLMSNNMSASDGVASASAGSEARDPFDAVRDEQFRTKWLEEHTNRPFLPSGRDKALQKPTRALLTDIMTLLYRALCEDWNDAHPTVLATSEDLIVVYFSKEGVKNEAGLKAYMSVFVRRNHIVVSYDLRKVNEGWYVETGDGHIMFTFRPAWVRQRAFLAANVGANVTSPPQRQSEDDSME
eukprot:PhM_4_TR7560/c0_g1_i2/m.61987